MDTEEMYRRGVADAERGEAHPFYYQHYYHYRRGFDRVHRRQQQPFQLMLTLVGVVVAIGVVFFVGRSLLDQPPQAVTAAATMPSPTQTPKPLFPTPTLEPTMVATSETAVLQIGRSALVQNTAGSKLRGRDAPSLQGKVQASFSEGDRVQILEGPVEADGLRWWRIENEQGSGWSAERGPGGEEWLVPQV